MRFLAGRHSLFAALGPVLVVLLLVAVSPAGAGGGHGSLDPSFGRGGTVTTVIGSSAFADAIAIQSDGKIVASGGGHSRFMVVRYNANGSLDRSFGSGGKAMTAPIGSDEGAEALVIQPDSKLVISGDSATSDQSVFALLRYQADGTLDRSFGSGGRVATRIGTDSADAHALVIQPDGKLVAAGTPMVTLARYQPDGSLDPSFGRGGTVTTAGNDALALAIQADVKLVAAGQSNYGGFGLVRYNPNGSLDGSFGEGGIVKTQVGSPRQSLGASALVIQPDGKLVAAGQSAKRSQSVFALVRYNPNGTLDRSFGSGEKVTTAIGAGSAVSPIGGLAIQPDGKLVAAGTTSNGLHV